jgi:hypothetical protein
VHLEPSDDAAECGAIRLMCGMDVMTSRHAAEALHRGRVPKRKEHYA